jgi:hypothetical protein
MVECGRGVNARGIAVVAGLVTLPLMHAVAQPVGEFEQLGIRTERWTIFPSLSVSAIYDDNVFAVPDDDDELLESDVLAVVAPEVTVEANTQRHAFAITSGAQIGRYVDLDDQNFNDFFVETTGRWDVTRTFDVTASFGFARTQEDQTDPDRVLTADTAAQTTDIDSFTGDITAAKDWQRTFARASVGVSRRSFEGLQADVFSPDGEEIVGSVDVNEDRDFFRIPFNLRVGYDVDRDYNLFINLGYSLVRFDEAEQDLATADFLEIADGGLVATRRIVGVEEGDSQDFETLSLRVGSEVDFARLVSGEFSLGVEQRYADAADEDDELGFSFDGDLDWIVTPRTTVNFSGSQGFEPATGGDAGGSTLRTRVGLDLSYDLTRQVALGGNFRYLRDDRGDEGRTDDDIAAGLSTSYTINRFAVLSASYEFRRRTSTDDDREFDRNRVLLTLTGRY